VAEVAAMTSGVPLSEFGFEACLKEARLPEIVWMLEQLDANPTLRPAVRRLLEARIKPDGHGGVKPLDGLISGALRQALDDAEAYDVDATDVFLLELQHVRDLLAGRAHDAFVPIETEDPV
jgi:hypothetical protein